MLVENGDTEKIKELIMLVENGNTEKRKELITILFDQMIAYANNLLVLARFYGQEIDYNNQPFRRNYFFIKKEDKELIKTILKDRIDQNEVINTGLSRLNCGILMMDEDDAVKETMAAVYLAGVILKFIENAEKHGEKESLEYSVTEGVDNIEFIFKNKINKSKEVKSKGMTKKFFVTLLNMLPQDGYEIEMYEKENNFISKLKIFNIKEERKKRIFWHNERN